MESASMSDFITNSELTPWQFKMQCAGSSVIQGDSWQEKYIFKNLPHFLVEEVSECKSRLVLQKNVPDWFKKCFDSCLLNNLYD